MASFPVPDEYKIVRHVQSVRTYVTELDQSNTPIITTTLLIPTKLGPSTPNWPRWFGIYKLTYYEKLLQEKQQRRDSKPRNYRSAICLWKEKLELAQSPLESAMLCVDIGRACMEIDHCDEALEYGCKALAFGEQVCLVDMVFIRTLAHTSFLMCDKHYVRTHSLICQQSGWYVSKLVLVVSRRATTLWSFRRWWSKVTRPC